MARQSSITQFGEYLDALQRRGVPIKEAHIEGSRFVFKFADGGERTEVAGPVDPVDLINWKKRK